MNYRIAISADHRGFLLKQYLMNECKDIQWTDYGSYTSERTDYPLFVPPVIKALKTGLVEYGILICGTGIGMAIAANRYKNIYAGVVWNADLARLSKEDDNVNILVLPADFITQDEAFLCVTSWLTASFKKGRYQDRLLLVDSQDI